MCFFCKIEKSILDGSSCRFRVSVLVVGYDFYGFPSCRGLIPPSPPSPGRGISVRPQGDNSETVTSRVQMCRGSPAAVPITGPCLRPGCHAECRGLSALFDASWLWQAAVFPRFLPSPFSERSVSEDFTKTRGCQLHRPARILRPLCATPSKAAMPSDASETPGQGSDAQILRFGLMCLLVTFSGPCSQLRRLRRVVASKTRSLKACLDAGAHCHRRVPRLSGAQQPKEEQRKHMT